jgi:phosphotransferase system enzyme I (PtsI)
VQRFSGIPASPGIMIGEAFIYNQDFLIPKYSISELQVEFEIDRFYKALRKTKTDLEALRKNVLEEFGESEAQFIDSHILMTEDQTLIQEVVNRMRAEKKNVEWIIYQVVDSLFKKFNQMDDDIFKDRAIDVLDIGRKIMQKLMAQKNTSLADLNSDVIVFCSDLSVSDTASMNKDHVKAFVTELGGRTSHSAILARALGIPAIVGLHDIAHRVTTGDTVIIDGVHGIVIVDPDEKAITEYEDKQKEYVRKEHESFALKDLPSITTDGREVALMANMEIPEQEIDSVIYHGAEGVGLYRSEFLYLAKVTKVLPSEEQQYNAYKFVLDKFPGQKVTIRTLDLGGDKILQGVHERELNPYLGWRAIRFCLARKDIFKTQLRALYRASVHGKLQIMFPMISGLEEVVAAKELLEEVKQELKKESIPFSDDVPTGIMIETPSAALMSDVLAQHADFFSIGTNDLIQYTLACDRTNEKIAYLFEPLHPSVLRMIKMTIDNAHKNNIPVSVCGEMASELLNAIVLVGLGVDSLSMGPISILEVKRIVRSIDAGEVEELAGKLLEQKDHFDVLHLVKEWVKDNLKFVYDLYK